MWWRPWLKHSISAHCKWLFFAILFWFWIQVLKIPSTSSGHIIESGHFSIALLVPWSAPVCDCRWSSTTELSGLSSTKVGFLSITDLHLLANAIISFKALVYSAGIDIQNLSLSLKQIWSILLYLKWSQTHWMCTAEHVINSLTNC